MKPLVQQNYNQQNSRVAQQIANLTSKSETQKSQAKEESKTSSNPANSEIRASTHNQNKQQKNRKNSREAKHTNWSEAGKEQEIKPQRFHCPRRQSRQRNTKTRRKTQNPESGTSGSMRVLVLSLHSCTKNFTLLFLFLKPAYPFLLLCSL